jgi:chromosomal replication initiation ATPase DnaA
VLTGPSQQERLLRARWEAMARLRDVGLSSPAIGGLLGRDHSTVLHGLRRYEAGVA